MDEERNTNRPRPLSAIELLARAESQRPIVEHASTGNRVTRVLGTRYAEVRVRSEVDLADADLIRRFSPRG